MAHLNVLVTGSSSGFGHLMVQELVKRGHTALAAIRDVAGKNAEVASQLTTLSGPGAAHVIEMDVTNDASVESGVASAIKKAGHIDAVINNAGIMVVGIDEAFTTAEVSRVFDTNLYGAMRVNRAVLPHLRSRGQGVLVHVSSNLARLVMPFAGVYTASKMALEGYAESLRYQLSPLGIDSVILEPGGYPTQLFAKLTGPADQQRISSYGQLAEMPQRIFGGFAEQMQGPNAPDPREVAVAAIDLIEAPLGTRPVRTLVDRFTGQALQTLNDQAATTTAGIFSAFGLEALLQPKKG